MIVVAAATGDMAISFADTARAIANGLGIAHYDLPAVEAGIVWQYRLSRAFMAASSGGGLALHDLNLGQVVASGAPDSVLTPHLIKRTWQVDATIHRTVRGDMNILYT